MREWLSTWCRRAKLYRLKPFVLVFCFFFGVSAMQFWRHHFNGLWYRDILIYLALPHDGGDRTLVYSFWWHCLVLPLVLALVVCYVPEILSLTAVKKILQLGVKTVKTVKNMIGTHSYTWWVGCLFAWLLISVIGGSVSLKDVKRLWAFYAEKSDFYEREFVLPSSDLVQFPDKKKNLIFIQVESLESDFEDNSFYGWNLLPELQALEPKGSKFAHFHDGVYTASTIASLIAAYTGLPLYSWTDRFFQTLADEQVSMLLGYYSLGNILQDNGYATYYLSGTDGDFFGTRQFVKEHGVENVIAREDIQRLYPEYEIIGSWGYGDADVFKIARQNLSKADKNKPYFLHIATIDTHGEYQAKLPKTLDNLWYNAISHTDKEVAAFVKWLQTRKDYEDTVIVIAGDHLRMMSDFNMPKHRDVYNLFIHAPKPNKLNRTFTQIDMFPTLLEAIGVKVAGHRLGGGHRCFLMNRPWLSGLIRNS
jgi:phosphoglycerol transferase